MKAIMKNLGFLVGMFMAGISVSLLLESSEFSMGDEQTLAMMASPQSNASITRQLLPSEGGMNLVIRIRNQAETAK